MTAKPELEMMTEDLHLMMPMSMCKRHTFTGPSALLGTPHTLERRKKTEVLGTTLPVEGTTLSGVLALPPATGQGRGEFRAS